MKSSIFFKDAYAFNTFLLSSCMLLVCLMDVHIEILRKFKLFSILKSEDTIHFETSTVNYANIISTEHLSVMFK